MGRGFVLMETSRWSPVFSLGLCFATSASPIAWDLETHTCQGDLCPPPSGTDMSRCEFGWHWSPRRAERGAGEAAAGFPSLRPEAASIARVYNLLSSGTRTGGKGSKQKHSCGFRGHEMNTLEGPYEGSMKNKPTNTQWKKSFSRSTPAPLTWSLGFQMVPQCLGFR